MTRRAILNVTSTKKSDTQMQVTNVSAQNANGTGGTYAANAAYINADLDARTGLKWSIYMPLAIGFDAANHENTRSKDTVFYRGYKEVIKYESNSSYPWSHRRILFWVKNPNLGANLSTVAQPNSPYMAYLPSYVGGDGYVRTFSIVPATATEVPVRTILFAGTYGSDWTDPMLAIPNRELVTIYSDTTFRINSANDVGCTRVRKCWYPINKNFYYGRGEAGDSPETHSLFHTAAKQGPGDLYVVDFFRAHQATQSGTDALSVKIEAKLYWHER